MITFPHCKINLGLSVTEKREDGYHNLETVFFPVPLCDVLEIGISKDGVTNFNTDGISIPGDNNNLCLRAYELLSAEFDLPPVNIFLLKNIPLGAGLGGGSSDASHTLVMLNDLFDLNLNQKELMNYASGIGADCAFFIKNRPAFAHGIGDQLEEIKLDLSAYYIVIVKPDIHISTVEAYSGINPYHKNVSVKDIVRLSVEKWKNNLINDFESHIFSKYPYVKKIKNILYDKGAVYASMSGSGSSVFGLFNKETDLRDEFENCYYWSGKL